MTKLSFLILFNGLLMAQSHPTRRNDDFEHPSIENKPNGRTRRDLPSLNFWPPKIEQDPDYWNNKAAETLRVQLNKNHLNKNVARNVIFFLGDGMGISTLMASRVLKGGEGEELSFEKFPYSGLAKTYCTNTQVADSACSATSYLSGVKGNYGTIGLTAAVLQGECLGQNSTSNHVDSIIKLAQDSGLRTGIITNTRITHATPAGAYANIADRNWENNDRLEREGGNSETCPDIAYQLVHGRVGKRLNLIMGGGRQEFITKDEVDVDGNAGLRTDNNLIEQWMHVHRKKTRSYVETKEQLFDVDNSVERLLAVFDSNHMPYHLDDNANDKPSLSEMVEKALDILETDNEKGFFLFVESGKIDHGHHQGLAKRALDETLELEKVVAMARARTSEKDTLIVVTADHSHSFTVSGYAVRLVASLCDQDFDVL